MKQHTMLRAVHEGHDIVNICTAYPKLLITERAGQPVDYNVEPRL